MKRVSTHLLDIGLGKPATDVPVKLERREASGGWQLLGSARTDHDGRCAQLLPATGALTPGAYRLSFDTASYYAAQKVSGLYPQLEINFLVRENEESFHIPVLLSANGFTTYRGS